MFEGYGDVYEGYGCVYIVESKGAVKIGHSKNLRARFCALQIDHIDSLTILAIIRNGRLEKELHRRFAHLHIRGEWYNYTDDLKQYVESLDFKPMGIDEFREQVYYRARFLKEILVSVDVPAIFTK